MYLNHAEWPASNLLHQNQRQSRHHNRLHLLKGKSLARQVRTLQTILINLYRTSQHLTIRDFPILLLFSPPRLLPPLKKQCNMHLRLLSKHNQDSKLLKQPSIIPQPPQQQHRRHSTASMGRLDIISRDHLSTPHLRRRSPTAKECRMFFTCKRRTLPSQKIFVKNFRETRTAMSYSFPSRRSQFKGPSTMRLQYISRRRLERL